MSGSQAIDIRCFLGMWKHAGNHEKGARMSKRSKKPEQPWNACKSLYCFMSTNKELSVKDFNLRLKECCGAIARSVLASPAYLTLLIGLLSGLCELARVFATMLVPIFIEGIRDSQSWQAFQKAGPLAMAALGTLTFGFGCILLNASIEKYRARRDLQSVYSRYGCFFPNLLASMLLASLVPAAYLKNLSAFATNNTSLLLIATCIISCLRTSTLLPARIPLPCGKCINTRLGRFAFSAIVQTVLTCTAYAITCFFRWNKLPPEDLSKVLAVSFLFHITWLLVLGPRELEALIAIDPFKTNSRTAKHRQKGDACPSRTTDLQTPKCWIRRNSPYYAIQAILLFTALVFAMMSPGILCSALDMLLGSTA